MTSFEEGNLMKSSNAQKKYFNATHTTQRLGVTTLRLFHSQGCKIKPGSKMVVSYSTNSAGNDREQKIERKITVRMRGASSEKRAAKQEQQPD